ncbi:MAG TPA: ABC transporter ATP-binding protein [Candidatus Acidoferrum sp.]|jgi:lipopolysaccharide transport system ATP-binding protein
MATAVIAAEGLGKRYTRGAVEARGMLRDSIMRFARNPVAALRRSKQETFWALKDVSLEVKEGEVLGLIGRNGAGKTTLLKILSRITRPTTGHAEIRGHVRSLLEVGTGFHGELTGRENTYFSGSLLGMKKREIDRKLDEIIAFAEIEKFIDTPVKHYSSGMYVRLAFAVAAHLEPEILLVDEVLAVGDINFQKKCLGKMGDVARAGRTVVLVSHSMAAINSLCTRCVILNSGGVEFDGATVQATSRYYAESMDLGSGSDLSDRRREGTGKAQFSSIRISPTDEAGRHLDVAYPGCDLNIEIEVRCKSDFAPANLAIIFYDSSGYRVLDTNTAQKGEFITMKAGQTAKAQFLLRDVLLRPGRYLVGLWIGREAMEVIDWIEHAVTIDMMEGSESKNHVVVFPGVYLCRFENHVSVQ